MSELINNLSELKDIRGEASESNAEAYVVFKNPYNGFKKEKKYFETYNDARWWAIGLEDYKPSMVKYVNPPEKVEKVKATKKNNGLRDYRLEYKGVFAYTNKIHDYHEPHWEIYNDNGYSFECTAWAVGLPSLKDIKKVFKQAVDNGFRNE